ncbi:hypothetical protein EHS25_002221 [Saitozyma podzolica]|uniref:NADP-dependent oxidoreductase domain-containing protein n=1 Tax=Saitozyma podzolica TaxID=1890683 RepID=A0A427YF29_9TREE|nr:hypothetical protein EHS25_002221 [Saitozyma podzolica]
MASGRTVTLNNGVKVPQLGFGTWLAAPGEVGRATEEALKVGFRHVDCAIIYGNQNEVADGIEASGVPRSDIFLVSKLWSNSHRPENVESDLDATLKELRTTYLDAYLIHWPVAMRHDLGELEPYEPGSTDRRAIDHDAPGIEATWKEMVRIYKETQKVRSIGVSNFTVEHLQKVIDATGVVPAFNQIECHPGLIQQELFDYCKEKGIIITAYSPLGNNFTGKPKIVDHPRIKAIADRLGKTPAQVCYAWGLHQGFCVLSKSVTSSRIKN